MLFIATQIAAKRVKRLNDILLGADVDEAADRYRRVRPEFHNPASDELDSAHLWGEEEAPEQEAEEEAESVLSPEEVNVLLAGLLTKKSENEGAE